MSHIYDAPKRELNSWERLHEFGKTPMGAPTKWYDVDRSRTVMDPMSYPYYWKMDWPNIHRWKHRMDEKGQSEQGIYNVLTNWIAGLPNDRKSQEMMADLALALTDWGGFLFQAARMGNPNAIAWGLIKAMEQVAWRHPWLWEYARGANLTRKLANAGIRGAIAHYRGVPWRTNLRFWAPKAGLSTVNYIWRKHLRSYRR